MGIMKNEEKIDIQKSCTGDFLQTSKKEPKNQILRRCEKAQKMKTQFVQAKPLKADTSGSGDGEKALNLVGKFIGNQSEVNLSSRRHKSQNIVPGTWAIGKPRKSVVDTMTPFGQMLQDMKSGPDHLLTKNEANILKTMPAENMNKSSINILSGFGSLLKNSVNFLC